jgi:hypothetical protein
MIHNKHMHQFIPSAMILKSAGTWTPSVASNVVKEARTAADASFTLLIPVSLPQSANLNNGARLKSIDVYYKVLTADCDDFATVELEKMALPANTAAPTGAAVATTPDGSHDTATKRKAQGEHSMTVSLDTPAYMGKDDAYVLQLVVDAAAGTVFTLYGARANFDLRLD